MQLEPNFWQTKSLLEMTESEWEAYVMAAANAVIANIFKDEENAKNFITPELLATF